MYCETFFNAADYSSSKNYICKTSHSVPSREKVLLSKQIYKTLLFLLKELLHPSNI